LSDAEAIGAVVGVARSAAAVLCGCTVLPWWAAGGGAVGSVRESASEGNGWFPRGPFGAWHCLSGSWRWRVVDPRRPR